MILHTCPVKGCPIRLPAALLMCRPHWRLVPAPIQSEVWRTYRAHERGTGPLAALRTAQLAATDAVNERLAP